MRAIIKTWKGYFKYPFHKLRDIIRRWKAVRELKPISKQIGNSNTTLFLQTDHLGETYVSCAYIRCIKTSGKEFLFLTSQKYTLQLIKLFPEISQAYLVSHNAIKMLNNRRIELAKRCNIQSLNIYRDKWDQEKPQNMIDAYKFLLNIETELPLNSVLTKAEDEHKIRCVLARTASKLNKTAILTPEVRSLKCSLLKKDFWIQLADCLVQNGYSVIFSSPQKYGGYPSVFLSIEETIVLARACGYVIGVRSGLLDILAGETEGFIQAIYPSNDELSRNDVIHLEKNFNLMESATNVEKMFQVFSLKNIRNDGKIIEIILKEHNEKTLIQEIVSNWDQASQCGAHGDGFSESI